MRVGNEETVLVSLYDVLHPVEVSVKLKLFVGSDEGIISESVVTVGEESVTAVLFVDPEKLPSSNTYRELQNYAFVSVTCPFLGFEETTQVLLSYERGFVFIQTDKPVYSPDQTVRIRVISLDQFLTPLHQKIRVDFVNPRDVIVRRSTHEEIRNGVISTNLHFYPYPLLGRWKIIAYYGKDFSGSETVEIEVQERDLPTFSVEIQPPSFILPIDEGITIGVQARYVNGRGVKGRCFIKVGVQEEDETPVILYSQGAFIESIAEISIDTDMLGGSWFEENVGRSLYIEATVVEHATGRSENASDVSAKFARSPYMFSWKRTVRYFKKGLPFEVKVDVEFMNGKPAPNVFVGVIASARIEGQAEEIILQGEKQREAEGNSPTEGYTNNDGQLNFRLFVPRQATHVRILLETRMPELVGQGENGINHNARSEFVISPFESPQGNEFLALRVSNNIMRPGRDNLQVDVFLNSVTAAPLLSYFVISRGKIISAGKKHVANVDGFETPVTYEMVPSARIVAYYISDSGHIIADSMWIEIERECENRFHVSPYRFEDGRFGDRIEEPILPLSLIILRSWSTPGTRVALLGVDKAALLDKNNHQLVSDKMYGAMEERDTGCGQGGGRSSEDVLLNAGLVVLTNLNLNVPLRQGLFCSSSATNNRRKRYVKNQRENHRVQRSSGIDLSDPKYISTRPEDVFTRNDFRESWAFDIIEIPDSDPGVTSVDQIYSVPARITTWSIQAFALHDSMAMCVLNPMDLDVFTRQFIHLHMPFSVVRKEVFEIQATVFNLYSMDIAVRMLLEVPEEICSDGISGELSNEKVFVVRAEDAMTITYMLVGLEVGTFPIKVAALTTLTSDVVEKRLRVLPEGVVRKLEFSTILDPGGVIIDGMRQDLLHQIEEGHCDDISMGNDGTQWNCLEINLPPTAVPDSAFCHVSIIGNSVTTRLTSEISELESWIRQVPTGGGEETMIFLSPNVYVLRYMTQTGSGTESSRSNALSKVQNGVVRALSFFKPDGSFASLSSRPGSTWLTAFASKVLCQASEFTFVDDTSSCGAIEWLLTAQRTDGAFVEVHTVYHREMKGGMEGDAALTAFVIIAMKECQCVGMIPGLEASLTRGTEFLEGQLDSIQRPYVVAIVTYALALVNSDRRFDANNMLKSLSSYDTATDVRFWGTDASSLNSDSLPYWYGQRPAVISVETTSYALLAQLALGDWSYSSPVEKWLSQQQNYGGAFVSTQDTVITLQALSEYVNSSSSLDLYCNITAPKSFTALMHLQEGDALVQRTQEIPSESIKGKLLISTTGEGVGQLNIMVKYNNLVANRDSECPFDLQVSILRLDGREVDRIRITVCVSYSGETPTNMAIIDVGLFSGFVPVKKSLRNLAGYGPINRVETSSRSVIFYVEYIPTERDGPLCFEFDAFRDVLVGNLHQAAVHVYDYYNPDIECTKYYVPSGPDLATLCNDDGICSCVSRNCAACSAHEHESGEGLVHVICDSAETYAFKIRVAHIERNSGFNIITGIVETVIKTDYDIDVYENSERKLWVSSSCECPVMRRGRSYMVIGRKFLQYQLERHVVSFKYIIDNSAIVRQWRKGRRFDYLNYVRDRIFSGYSPCD